jgi:tetratricopeptide (TPR) repeat protein
VTSMPPGRQNASGRSRPWPPAGAALLVSLTLLLSANAESAASEVPHSAPLDTLVTAPLPPVAAGNMVMTRRHLPEISTTTVPRQPPPAVPPRLDDPLAGERHFRAAVHASRTGRRDQAELAIRSAVTARPGDSRLALWQIGQALSNREPGAFVFHLPGAWRAVTSDPLAAPRLALQAQQAAILQLGIFWTVLVVVGLAAWWRSLAHDMSALLYRDPDHRLRRWTPWLLILSVVLMRPGWLGALALISVPLLLQTRGKSRALLLSTWLVTLALVFPNWPILRESVPIVDPESETTLLVRAGQEEASALLLKELRERLATAEEPDRQHRLRLAIALQEARRGRFTASSEHFRTVLTERPDNVMALVGLANNSYYLSRFDEALRGFQQARELAPQQGEIPYNMAQVYLKKLFLPEAGQAIEDARTLGFAPVGPRELVTVGSDFSPLVYLELPRQDLRSSARSEAERYPPLVSLAAWNYFLGAPPLPLFMLLGGLLVIGLLLAYWGGLQDRIRHCDSCGNEICRSCCRQHGDSLICPACTEIAERARSEMVLATLLKNRSRTVGLATTARLVRLARLVPGAAHLAIGEVGRAARRLVLLSLAVFLIGGGWAFDPSAAMASPGLILAEETIHPLWLPLPAAAWPGPWGWPVVLGWILLAAVLVQALLDAARLRQRLPERLIQQQTGPLTGPVKA